MREAVGGTALLKIVIIFLAVYIGFMAVVLKYGRIFRIKNRLVNVVEQQEGFETEDEIIDYAKKIGFNGKVCACYERVNRGETDYYYYKIRVWMDFQILRATPLISIPVAGETRIIETGKVTPKGEWDCYNHPCES